MSRFLRSDRFFVRGALTTQRLVPQVPPIDLSPQHALGSWSITTEGSIERPISGSMTPLYPRGAEALVAGFAETPPGWFDVPVTLGPEWQGRRLITNTPQAEIAP